MPIKEIDPNDPIFLQLNSEARTLGKLNMSKFAMPMFMQKRETIIVEPKAKPIPVPVPVPVVPEPEPIIEPLIEPIKTPVPVQQPTPEPVKQVRSVDTLPQVKVRVKQSWELPIPRDIRRKPAPPSPIPEPAQPQPVPARQPMPAYIWPKKPAYQPTYSAEPQNEYQYLDSADIYGTGKKFHEPRPDRPTMNTTFKLPSFFQRKKETFDPFFEESVLLDTKPKTKMNWKPIGKLVAQVAIGVILVAAGLFSGELLKGNTDMIEFSKIFYTYQLGTLAAIVGCIVGYDAFRKAGKL